MNAEQINIGVDSDGEAKIVIGGQQIHLGLDSDDSGEDGAAPLFSKDAALCGRLMSFPVMAPSSSLLPKCEDPGSEDPGSEEESSEEDRSSEEDGSEENEGGIRTEKDEPVPPLKRQRKPKVIMDL